MTTNPHLGTPTEGGWAMGFAFGFMSPPFSKDPPLVIAPEQLDAFNEGMLVGQQVAIEGLEVENPCVSLSQEPSPPVETFDHVLHKGKLLKILGKDFIKHVVRGASSAFVFLFLLAIPGPPLLSPESMFAGITVSFREQLDLLGITRGDLFFSMGIDEKITGCELLLSTRVFKNRAQAVDAALKMGRPKLLLAHWSIDLASSFEIVALNP